MAASRTEAQTRQEIIGGRLRLADWDVNDRPKSALAELAATAGLENPKAFTRDHFYQRFGPGDVRSLDVVYPFLQDGALRNSGADDALQSLWKRASPSH